MMFSRLSGLHALARELIVGGLTAMAAAAAGIAATLAPAESSKAQILARGRRCRTISIAC